MGLLQFVYRLPILLKLLCQRGCRSFKLCSDSRGGLYVGLSFNQVPAMLNIPFSAITKEGLRELWRVIDDCLASP